MQPLIVLFNYYFISFSIINVKNRTYNANVSVKTVSKNGKTLDVDCAYAYPDAEFLFSAKVKGVSFNGKAVKADLKGKTCKMELKTPGVYTFTF